MSIHDKISSAGVIWSIISLLIGAIISFTVYATKLDERSLQNQVAIKTIEQKQEEKDKKDAETTRALDEIKFNLKNYMEINGVRYIEKTGDN